MTREQYDAAFKAMAEIPGAELIEQRLVMTDRTVDYATVEIECDTSVMDEAAAPSLAFVAAHPDTWGSVRNRGETARIDVHASTNDLTGSRCGS